MAEHNTQFLLTSTVAQILRVCEHTVRAWERRGLLSARRTSSGVRLFDEAEVAALATQLAQQRRDHARERRPR
jgi:DNA-binding transcriptional MerR regulator